VTSATIPVVPALTPVIASCERCGGGFPLFALLQHGTGACPHCRQPLAPDRTAELVEWAAVVDAAYGRLVTALQQLEELPGHLMINTDQLARTLSEDAARGRPRSPWDPVGRCREARPRGGDPGP